MYTNNTSPSAHTPEPWELRQLNNQEFDILSAKTHVATVFGTATQAEDGANARLISQAPAMYKFIAELVDVWNDDNSEDKAESFFADAVNILLRVQGEQ